MKNFMKECAYYVIGAMFSFLFVWFLIISVAFFAGQFIYWVEFFG